MRGRGRERGGKREEREGKRGEKEGGRERGGKREEREGERGEKEGGREREGVRVVCSIHNTYSTILIYCVWAMYNQLHRNSLYTNPNQISK